MTNDSIKQIQLRVEAENSTQSLIMRSLQENRYCVEYHAGPDPPWTVQMYDVCLEYKYLYNLKSMNN